MAHLRSAGGQEDVEPANYLPPFEADLVAQAEAELAAMPSPEELLAKLGQAKRDAVA